MNLAGRRRSAVIVTLNLAVAAVYLVHVGHGIGLGCYRIDLEVYRAGATVLLHGCEQAVRRFAPGVTPVR